MTDAEAQIVRNPNPVTLPSSTTVIQAALRMDSRNVSAVLVTEGDANLVGIFTGRDAVSRVLADGKDPATTTLAEVMTYNPVIVTPRHTALEALQLMEAARCRHLPMVHDGKIVALVSRGDFRGLEREMLRE